MLQLLFSFTSGICPMSHFFKLFKKGYKHIFFDLISTCSQISTCSPWLLGGRGAVVPQKVNQKCLVISRIKIKWKAYIFFGLEKDRWNRTMRFNTLHVTVLLNKCPIYTPGNGSFLPLKHSSATLSLKYLTFRVKLNFCW